jgi:ATP-dependent DNA helicase UvrD/PcrA
MNNFTPRPSQEQILRYTGGRLGIAAVPGSGKTHLLSALAAQIIRGARLEPGQEVLVVTLVNSAVDNFERRIRQFFDSPLEALYRYRVRTLHGLAHDIVREKPTRVGLDERFAIIDEREAGLIRREAVQAWLAAHPHDLDDYLDPALEESRRDWVRRDPLPDMVDSLALAFVRSAKDRRLTPQDIRDRLDRSPGLPLAELGWNVYADYQRALAYRGAVDFDDLIRLALDMLESDADYLERLRRRFPYVLEDEAQDSSRLQQSILALLSGEGGNWVRVGDPNQAIFETFTTASPELLRRFIAENPSMDMPESGRSQQSIIDLANHLIDWTMTAHPAPEVGTALAPPYIQPAPEGDPQPNPPDDPAGIRLVNKRHTPEEEVSAVVDSLGKWLPQHPNATVAVLVPRNQRGVELIDALKRKGLEYVEVLASTSPTRAAAGSLSYVLTYLADPQSASKLSRAYLVWRRDWRDGISLRRAALSPSQGRGPERAPLAEEDITSSGEAPEAEFSEEDAKARGILLTATSALIRKLPDVENFVAPQDGATLDLLEQLADEDGAEGVAQELAGFRVHVRRWLEAVTLPIDQLILTLAQDIFSEPADLALAHKLALVLHQAADDHSEWRLPELVTELAVIARNERRFIGFSLEDTGFDPARHRGVVVVTTMHKAKGLEWDRVYLMSVNNYDFPSNMPNDRYISEKWFIRGGLNLEAETLAQLTVLESGSEFQWYEEGAATLSARTDYVKERLRLLYVGITRAKKELIVTWNSGRQGEATPALPISDLIGWWETVRSGQA